MVDISKIIISLIIVETTKKDKAEDRMNKIVIKGRVVYKHNMVKIVKKSIDDSTKKTENPEYNMLYNLIENKI